MTINIQKQPLSFDSPLRSKSRGVSSLGLLEHLWGWHERARQRHQLAQLDDRALKDMGISKSEARREPPIIFWRV